MPRLLILSQYFPPEMGAPQARLSELGERLVDRGWEVEALTALPNYPTGRVFSGYRPTRVKVENVGRIRTVRTPLVTSQGGFVKRLISYFSFVATASLRGPRYAQRPDVLFVESPPLFLGLAGRWLARRWRCPYVFNVSDLWPASAVHMGVVAEGSWMVRLAERLEHGLYRRAAAVTGQSSEIVESVRRAAPDVRAETITNGVEPTRFGPDMVDDEARALLGPEPGPIFLYAGLLGLAQGLDAALTVVRDLPDDVPGRLVMVGDGPLRAHLAQRIAAEGIRRARLVDAQPRERIPALLAAADVAFVSLGMRIPGAVPSKIYEAMASALPILLVADGEPARRIADARCGISVPCDDTDAVAEGWRHLATDADARAAMGTAGRQAAEEVYDRGRIADRLDALLRDVVAAAASNHDRRPGPETTG